MPAVPGGERGTVTRSDLERGSWNGGQSPVQPPCHIQACLLAPAGVGNRAVGQEPSMPDKLPAPCRIENRACEAGAISWQHANQPLPESEIGLWGRSLPCPISFLPPAGLRIGLVGQAPSLPDKLPAPCRIEKRACGAGAFPARQASCTLPD